MRRVATAGLAAACALLALTGCGTSSGSAPTNNPSSSMSMGPGQTMSGMPSAPSGAATQAAASTITIKGYAYSSTGTVRAGSTVTVVNDDPVAHTVTADDKGGFDLVVPANATKTFTAPSAPGSYPYHCAYHANMHGTVKVT